MRLRSLRSFSLLAILSCRSSRHYARAQSTSASTYTWGEPFTVDYSSTASLIPNSASSVLPTLFSSIEVIPLPSSSVIIPSSSPSFPHSSSLSLPPSSPSTLFASTTATPSALSPSTTHMCTPLISTQPTPTSIPLQTLSATGTTASPSASTTNAAYTRKPHPLTMGIVGVIAGTAGLLVV
ncbi:hypothetical protein GQ43DRAFT_481820 [Delitschia confertaspora ATCC 74209]|uniref:Uncharacterized protein n=1 Tax=Delitschia confertaspora ATCC 74209 TaxID=1513339 RepID=A0A9P4JJ82_9PLEO|nr:hypothetical protein GQ43DRAFT_481820 [Delitschia confertaspora ATCC 74209]